MGSEPERTLRFRPHHGCALYFVVEPGRGVIGDGGGRGQSSGLGESSVGRGPRSRSSAVLPSVPTIAPMLAAGSWVLASYSQSPHALRRSLTRGISVRRGWSDSLPMTTG